MADPTDPSLSNYLTPPGTAPSWQDVPAAPPQNTGSQFNRDTANLSQSYGAGLHLMALQQPPGYAERISNYFRGNPQTDADIAARKQASEYYQSPEATGFLKANPQYLTAAQQDPTGFATALQTHLGLARAALGHVAGMGEAPPAQPGPSAYTIPADSVGAAMPPLDASNPAHVAAVAQAHGVTPQQAHASMAPSAYSRGDFINATQGMSRIALHNIMGMLPQNAPREAALSDYLINSRDGAVQAAIRANQTKSTEDIAAADAARANWQKSLEMAGGLIAPMYPDGTAPH